MNETNLPEKVLPEAQLNSWHPRHPSAGLKRRIFSTATKSSTLATRWIWGALTPTMACMLLTLTLLNSSNGGLHQKPVMAMVLSNQTYGFSDNESAQTAQNHLASVTFDWTNHSVFNSSMGFTPTTNSSN
jgi:hypothetical protein